MFVSLLLYHLQYSRSLIKRPLVFDLLRQGIFSLALLEGQYETILRPCPESVKKVKAFQRISTNVFSGIMFVVYFSSYNYAIQYQTWRCADTACRIAESMFAHIIMAGSPIPLDE